MNTGTINEANGDAGNSANVITTSSANGAGEAAGWYSARAIGPVEHLRARYSELRGRLSAKGLRGSIDRLINGKRLTAELMAIPMEEKWADEFPNLVTTVGKNFALDTFLDGTGYTKTGPYIGLLRLTGGAATSDTMAAHSGWIEVGSINVPAYTVPRKLAVWSGATGGEKSLSGAGVSFEIQNTGTVDGCFLVLGTGASSTLMDTGGILYSAGAFTGGSKTLNFGDTLAVSYKATL